MRRVLFAVACTGLLALGAPAAQAGNQSTYTGQCWLGTVPDPTAEYGTQTGFLYAQVTTTSTDPQDVPVQADVTCSVTVNGGPGPSVTYSGAGLIVGTTNVAYVTYGPASVMVCTTVDYTGPFDTTPTASFCVPYVLPPVVHSPNVGGVFLVATGTGPVASVTTGDLANPMWWNCSGGGGVTTPYVMTCLPQPGTLLDWHCTYETAQALNAGGSSRVATNCDGGAPEAQTPAVSNTGALAIGGGSAQVTAFTCTVDDGAGNAATGLTIAWCGS